MTWDKQVAEKFRKIGLTQEQISQVIGEISDHRQFMFIEGLKKGFDDGFKAGKDHITLEARKEILYDN